jgi:hypothetical protein
MTIWERLQIAIATFRRLGGIELPDDGRSSEETLSGAMSAYLGALGSVSPVVDFEMLKCLKRLWIYNPDMSQYVGNIVNLGNPGHQLSIDARTDAIAESAIARLNEAASRIYQIGVGVDGLLNQYLTSVAWSGAISSEDVVNLAAQRVEKVVLVPVEQIRFRYNKDLDVYEPFQQATGLVRRTDRNAFGLVPLNAETYRYYAISTVENSPYAKPPATAAVETILESQKPLMENIRFIAQKFGLLGLVTASVVAPPRRPTESDSEYQERCKKYLKSVRDALSGNFRDGLMITYRDQKLEHTDVGSQGAKGVYDVNRISEEQVMSGLGMQPAFFGRTDSTTETFADVVYYLLEAQVANMQRLVKRRQERTYRLDLRLAGIDVDSVNLNFAKAHSRNGKNEAETEKIKFETVLEKVKSGLISPDQGAQEMGEETWFDIEQLTGTPDVGQQSQGRSFAKDNTHTTITLVYDKRSHSYRYQPEKYEIWSGSGEGDAAHTVVPFIKKKAQLRASN